MTKSKSGYCCPAHETGGGKKPVRAPPRQCLPVGRRVEYECDSDSDDGLLEGMKTMTLYHQTTAVGGKAIATSGEMRPGSRGMYGAGIYFAETPKQTIGKALVDPNETRYMVKATVAIGDERVVHRARPYLNDEIIADQGYDSVLALPGAGLSRPERVVYNSDQVQVESVRRMCAAFIKKGKPCSRCAEDGRKYCWQH